MEDYSFSFPQGSLTSGRIVFRADNVGQVDHELTLVALPKNLPGTLDQQLHSETRRAVLPLTILPARGPGRSGFFSIDLSPGRYGFVCFVTNPGDDESHALKGMNAELTVE